MYNSTWIDYENYSDVQSEGTWHHAWNITSMVNFTILNSPYFQIWFNYARNYPHAFQCDYLGLTYKFSWGTTEYLPETEEEVFHSTFYGLIWLLIFYLPVLAVTNVVGKYGFLFGMTIMLLTLGFSQAGLTSTMIVGFIAIAIVAYKGA